MPKSGFMGLSVPERIAKVSIHGSIKPVKCPGVGEMGRSGVQTWESEHDALAKCRDIPLLNPIKGHQRLENPHKRAPECAENPLPVVEESTNPIDGHRNILFGLP